MEAVEDHEGDVALVRRSRFPQDEPGHARVQVADEGRRLLAIGQRDVDRQHGLRGGGVGRVGGEGHQVRQVQPRLQRGRPQPRGIGDRLVHAGDPELPRRARGGIGGEPDNVAKGEVLGGQELPRDEDRGRCGRRAGDQEEGGQRRQAFYVIRPGAPGAIGYIPCQ